MADIFSIPGKVGLGVTQAFYWGLPIVTERVLHSPEIIYVKDGVTVGIGTGDGNYVVFAGRLSQEKGIETLLQAWRNTSFDLSLKIVGDGPMIIDWIDASTKPTMDDGDARTDKDDAEG